MPLIIPTHYGERSYVFDEPIEPKIKYFFAFEGNNTEFAYFEGLKNYSREIGICELIEILPIDRTPDDTESHPLKVLEKVMIEVENGNIPIDNRDKVYLIIDRDRNSFKQFTEFLDRCKNNRTNVSFEIGITNPCFEVWLLCHLDNFSQLNKIEMFKNTKFNKNRRHCEKLLSNEMNGYNKSKLNFLKFMDQIPVAIENEKTIAQHILEIEAALGSNIGRIITEMKKDHRSNKR
ncbi:MAG: RloB domain-containing protein [Tindallia sp. MSAO_Bac2]|nr:MAG: RloB domain-containing protein [Tindallia sp. MSAO_Bac2]